jgi:DNA-binding CsgD family transcriptional regulator/tetratricopeptide (TPR) repeat protein
MERGASPQSAELLKNYPTALPNLPLGSILGGDEAMLSDSRRPRKLVGRGTELAELDRLLDALGKGRNGAVYISGEPGIGKTSLIAEVLAGADERGYRTLSGRAAEFESDVPFVLFVDALERPMAEFVQEGLAPADEEIGHLASVFLSLEAGAYQRAVAASDERQVLLRAIRAVLGRLAEAGPLVLALDDLHWADSASVDLACHLLHRGFEGPVLLVLASRPAQSDSRLLTALDEAERHDIGTRLELSPLTMAEADELLGDQVDPALRGSLYRESGGNPFYLEQLSGAVRRGDSVAPDRAEVSHTGLPAAVSGAIRAEVEALVPLQRTVLQAAAVLGDPFEPGLVAPTADVAESTALETLDELLERDLIRASDSPLRFHFRHPIVRRAVYELAGPGWTLGAHTRAAAALEARGAAITTLAHHVECSAEPGDEAAIAVLTRAGEETTSRAPASAAEWFGAALRLIPERPDNLQRRLGLLAQRAAALGSAGDVEDTREALRAFLRLSPRDASSLRQQAAVLAALLDELLGRNEDARTLLLDELATMPNPDAPEAADLKRVMAFTYFLDADWKAMSEWARAALSAGGEGMVKVGAGSALALAEQSMGNIEAAKRSVSDAADLFDRLTDGEVAQDAGVTGWLGWAEICMEHFDAAAGHLRRATTLSRASGQRIGTANLLVVQGQALAFQGRIRELTEVAEGTVEAALMSSSNLFISWAMAMKCALDVWKGDLYAAVRSGERALSVGAVAGPLARSARMPLAEALLELGEPERSRELLLGPDGEPELPPFQIHAAICYELLTRAELMLERPDRAAELADRASELARRLDLRVPLAQALRAQAFVALERGEPEEAAARALESVQLAEKAGAVVEAARSRILAGRALTSAGERTRAVTELQAAHEQLLASGALRYCDEAARELRRLGRAVPRATADVGQPWSIAGLTRREIEVLEFVAAGKTNREIANELFLSVRTVDRHLARIFEKLRVNSRAAAASQFERARAETPSTQAS